MWLRSALFTAVLWLSEFVVDIIEDVPLAIHQQRLPCHPYSTARNKNSRRYILNPELISFFQQTRVLTRMASSLSSCKMRLTSDTKWSNSVLVQCEALLQSVSSHVLVEDITSSEIQNSTVVLVLRN